MSIDLAGPFRGSTATAAGVLTRGALRGPRFQRLFPDVYAPAALPPDLALRSRAAAVLVRGRGVLAGYSAAEIHGASCGPADAPAEVLLTRPGCQGFRCTGLRVRRDLLEPGDIVEIGGVALTSPAWSAFDLGRWACSPTERVVALDALGRAGAGIAEVARMLRLRPGAHHRGRLVEALRSADPRAESPMESRMRMALVLAGLPAPAVQHEVVTDAGRFRLDLAYPSAWLALEYDGAEHRTPHRARADLVREAALVRQGWTVLRFTAYTVLHRPWRIADAVARHLAR